MRLSKSNLIRLLSLTTCMFGIIAGVTLVRRAARLHLKAQLAGVDVYIEPEQQTLPPDSVFKVMMDAKQFSLAFVRIVIVFEPSDVQLASEITTSTELNTVIERTSMVDANGTGRAAVVLGLTPGDTAPTGIFELADFTLAAVSTIDNDLTALTIDSSDIQIVEKSTQVLSGVITPSNLVINPVAPTVIPTSTPTIGPTPTIVAEGPSATPSATITETPTSTFIPTLVPTETVAIQLPTEAPLQLTPTPIPTAAPIAFGPQYSPSPTPTPSPTPVSTSAPVASSPSQSGGTPSSGGSVPSSSSAPSSSAPRKVGDINGDGKVNIYDLSVLLSRYNKVESAAWDLNNDGRISILDLSVLLSNWGE